MTPLEQDMLYRLTLELQHVIEGAKFYKDGRFLKWEGMKQIEELETINRQFGETLAKIKSGMKV